MHLRYLPLALVLLLPLTARADTPGVNLQAGEYYAIDSCPQVSGGCSSTTIGAADQGSITLQVGYGEVITARIGTVPVLWTELSGGTAWENGQTTVYGQLFVIGSISTYPARTITDDDDTQPIDSTILVDTSGGYVRVFLPEAYYFPGRRLTVKKISDDTNPVYVTCQQGGEIDGAAANVFDRQWEFRTVEATPAGSYQGGFTTDVWSVVGH